MISPLSWDRIFLRGLEDFRSTYHPGPSLIEVAQGQGVLMRGHSGEGVRELQAALNLAGAQPPLEEDGLFGPLTERALREFQGSLGVPIGEVDGMCGLESLLPLLMMLAQSALGNSATARGPGLGSAIGAASGLGLPRCAPQLGASGPADSMKAGAMQRSYELGRNLQRAAEPPSSGGPAQTHTPFISQFDGRVPGAGDTACYRAVRVMAAQSGVRVPESTENRIQVATGEDQFGRVSTSPERAQQARDYIDRQLDAGRPVAAGVSHRGGYGGNRDGITDHFVLITGRGVDQGGRKYYSYHDPATRNPEQGDGNSAFNRRTGGNRFYVDDRTGNLVHQGHLASGAVKGRHSELSMVVLSDGSARPGKRAVEDPGAAGMVGDAYRDYREKLGGGSTRLTSGAEGQLQSMMQKMDETVELGGRPTTRRALVDEIARKADVPPELVAGIWYREDGAMRTDRYLHNGEKLGRPTQLVPQGIYFREDQFVDAAVHALRQKRAAADELGLHYRSNDTAAMAAFAERYNGFGYRSKGRSSAYVTGGTEHYRGGMYVADHVYDPNAHDRRLGVLPIVLALRQA